MSYDTATPAVCSMAPLAFTEDAITEDATSYSKLNTTILKNADIVEIKTFPSWNSRGERIFSVQ